MIMNIKNNQPFQLDITSSQGNSIFFFATIINIRDQENYFQMGQTVNKEQKPKIIWKRQFKPTSIGRMGVDMTKQSNTEVYSQFILQIQENQPSKMKKTSQYERKYHQQHVLPRGSLLMETNLIDEEDHEQEDRELAKEEEIQERNNISMKVSTLEKEKKEKRHSADEQEKNKMIRLSLQTMTENSIISEEVLDYVDKYLNQIQEQSSTLQAIQTFLQQTIGLLDAKAIDAEFEELFQQSKLKNEYLSKTFLPLAGKIYELLKQRVYGEAASEFTVVAKALENEQGKFVSLDACLVREVKEQSQKMQQQSQKMEALSLQLREKEEECEGAKLKIKELTEQLASLESKVWCLQEEMAMQVQIASSEREKRSKYKNQILEKQQKINKLSKKTSIFDKIKNKINNHEKSNVEKSVKH